MPTGLRSAFVSVFFLIGHRKCAPAGFSGGVSRMLLCVPIVLPYGTNTICVMQNKLEIYNHDSDAKQTGRRR